MVANWRYSYCILFSSYFKKKLFILKIIFLVNIEGSHKVFYAMSAKKFYGDIPYVKYYITDKLVGNKTLDILVLSLCTSHYSYCNLYVFVYFFLSKKLINAQEIYTCKKEYKCCVSSLPWNSPKHIQLREVTVCILCII